MKHESEIKLQAYLDGELPAAEAAEVKAMLEQDAEGRGLLEELRGTRAALAGNEMPRALPESREFFWSKIEREIERQEAKPAAPPRQSWYAWLQRHVMPVSGMALAVGLVGVFALRSGSPNSQLGEMEVASDDMSSYTFRDQQEKMTMVWLYDRNADNSENTEQASDVNLETE